MLWNLGGFGASNGVEKLMNKLKTAIFSLLLASSAFAADPKTGVSLTVYSAADPATFDPKSYLQLLSQNPYYAQQMPMPGFGVVRDVRKVQVDGKAPLRFTDVAAGIDPTTVAFRSFTDPSAAVAEQNFEFDLVSSQKLLKRYVDKKVVVERSAGEGKTETITGTLLNADSGLILKDDAGGVRIINNYTGIQLADAAQLITKPTLVWSIDTQKAGEQTVEVSYQTDGITWRADYSLILNADDTKADVSSWVTLLNLSGVTYPNANLKLVAGDVQRVQRNAYQYMEQSRVIGAAMQDQSGGGFTEKSFFEYHLYTLGRQTTLEQNSTKQIELFEPRAEVPVEKVFVYYGLPQAQFWQYGGGPQTDRNLGTEMNKKVDLYVRFKNSEEQGLGIPLPAGRVRVYKRDDADGNVEFVGEDVIQHTPKEEEILIKMGSAFDIVGERKQTDFQVDLNGHWITESFEIKLRNHKETPATVIVKENLFRWANWQISNASHKWEKQDSRTIHMPVELKAGEEKTLTYTVKYTW